MQTGDMAQAIDCLLLKSKALSSNPSTTIKVHMLGVLGLRCRAHSSEHLINMWVPTVYQHFGINTTWMKESLLWAMQVFYPWMKKRMLVALGQGQLHILILLHHIPQNGHQSALHEEDTPFKLWLGSLFPLISDRWCPQTNSPEQKLKCMLMKQIQQKQLVLYVRNSFLFKVIVCRDVQRKKWTSLHGHSQKIPEDVDMLPLATTLPSDFKI
jgi:hypothetical protein